LSQKNIKTAQQHYQTVLKGTYTETEENNASAYKFNKKSKELGAALKD
jgi:hypothetical protein